ncbi:hypothetical protein KNJ79_08825 [Sphingopyxis indica]|uniref:hypothetical protein n=1 Tax=Sphingopyxis indica TaxID=436663 RepID=UPI0029395383|nr:hypothetical protein [Sphingopyxis indica]WOF44961.1 hypothetical protein KNJ79_08825 [Sphingopyxis indica]
MSTLNSAHVTAIGDRTGIVGMAPDGNGSFGSSVTLEATITDPDHMTAEAIVDEPHRVCLYSNAVHGNVDVAPRLAVN